MSKKIQVIIEKDQRKCHSCEQTFPMKAQACPHCKAPQNAAVYLDGYEDSEEFQQTRFDESRSEQVRNIFARAMDCRYKDATRSKELLYSIISVDNTHYEARIKISWHEIRVGNYAAASHVLQPVISSSSTATCEQKKRAYNNMCCSFLFCDNPDFHMAEKYAKAGIDQDGKGTTKLWENYANSLQLQGRLVEARDAFMKALSSDPTSSFAKKSLKKVDKDIKQNIKKSTKSGKREEEKYDIMEDKENSAHKVNSNNVPVPGRSLSTKSLSLKNVFVTLKLSNSTSYTKVEKL